MANGNPTFNNPAVFIGAADEPKKQVGSSRMAKEEIGEVMVRSEDDLSFDEFIDSIAGTMRLLKYLKAGDIVNDGDEPISEISVDTLVLTPGQEGVWGTTEDGKSEFWPVKNVRGISYRNRNGKPLPVQTESKKLMKKITLKEFQVLIRKMVNEAIVKHLKEDVAFPPTPARQMIASPQRVGGKPASSSSQPPPIPQQTQSQPVDINAILAKREKGQQLTPQEKRAYLDHVASQNTVAQKQAQDQQAKSGVGQSLAAIEKNPERFVK